MSEHTSEPWHIDAGPRCYSICDSRGRVIADMRLPDDNGAPIEEVDVNAKLLVAARETREQRDELLAVLRDTVIELERSRSVLLARIRRRGWGA